MLDLSSVKELLDIMQMKFFLCFVFVLFLIFIVIICCGRAKKQTEQIEQGVPESVVVLIPEAQLDKTVALQSAMPITSETAPPTEIKTTPVPEPKPVEIQRQSVIDASKVKSQIGGRSAIQPNKASKMVQQLEVKKSVRSVKQSVTSTKSAKQSHQPPPIEPPVAVATVHEPMTLPPKAIPTKVEHKVTPPTPPKDTVPKNEYGTFRGIEQKMVASVIPKQKKAKRPKPKNAVPRDAYATMAGIGNKLEASDKEEEEEGGEEEKVTVHSVVKKKEEPKEEVKYIDFSPADTPKQEEPAPNYVEFDKKPPPETKQKKVVGSQVYGTMQAAPAKALSPTVAGKIQKKGKVGADQYGTFGIADKNALQPTIVPGKKGAKFAAKEAYATMFGVGKMMAASKRV